jgi:hypothetical protein
MSTTYLAFRGRMKRNIGRAEVRNHIPKRVPKCLMLRNHNIIVHILSD